MQIDTVIPKKKFNLEEYDWVKDRDKILEIAKRHEVKKVHVVGLGDLISGGIHKTVQITNKENVIDQIKVATEYLSSFCYSLTEHFESVFFYNVSGNHSRIDKKEESPLV